jgi:hypothetical protein
MVDYEVKFRSSKRLYHFEYDHPDHDIPLNFMTSPAILGHVIQLTS